MTQATGTRMGDKSPSTRAWAYGGMIFAATMLVVIGVYQLFLGIAAIARNEFFVVGPNYYYTVSTTTWGWIHLGIGIVAILVGLFLYTGMMWARVAGVIMAALSAIANFFFAPYYPLWSILIIALDIFVIWAIATVGSRREVAAMKAEYMGTTSMRSGAGGDADVNEGDRWPAANRPSERTGAAETRRASSSDLKQTPERHEAGVSDTGSAANRPTSMSGNQPTSGAPRD